MRLKKMKKPLLVLLGIIALGGVIYGGHWYLENMCLVDCDYYDPLDPATTVVYKCENEEILYATFGTNGYLDLSLYDGKKIITYPRLSEFKSRYSIFNEDGSTEFWSEGDENLTAYIREDGVVTHQCNFWSSGE